MTAPAVERFNSVARSRVLLVLSLAVAVQLSLAAGIDVAGVHPDLMVAVAVAAGIVGGEERGAIVGFAAGLLTDLFVQAPFGLSALSFTLVGFGTGLFRAAILRAPWWLVAASAAVGSAAGVVVYALIGAVLDQSQMISDHLGPVIGVVAGLNGLASLIVVPVMRWSIFPDSGQTRRRQRW
jgi:rod shape-determining protein MreD